MRILLLTHYYPPETGAPQHRWAALARGFVAHGHDLHVVTPEPHYPHGTRRPEHAGYVRGTSHRGAAGETVHRVAYRPTDGRVRTRVVDEVVAATDAVRTVRRGLGGWRPDVVVATVPSLAMLFAGRVVARRLGVPFVAEVRDAWPDLFLVAEDWEDGTAHGRRSAPARWGRRAVAGLGAATTRVQRSADAAVATTEAFAAVLRERGVPAVHVVRNAAHAVPGYEPGPARDGADLRVLYAGTVGRAQGLGTAVEAAARATRDGARVRLRVVGSGADRDALEALARRTRAPVEFVPPVDRATLAGHYAWADTVLVSLRPWSALELAVPSKLYEVMGLGKHVTAVLGGEAAAIVESQRAGHVTPPGDPDGLARLWRRLAADRVLLEVPPQGRAWAAEHADADRLTEHYLDLLAETLEASRVG